MSGIETTTKVWSNGARRQERFNRVMKALLRSPFHRLASGRLTLLYVTGRKTGTKYEIPTAFSDHDGLVLLASPGGWVRNLRGGTVIELQHHGRRIRARAEVADDRDRALEIATALLPPNPILRRFTGVGLDESRLPRTDEFDAARARGVAFIALHPISA